MKNNQHPDYIYVLPTLLLCALVIASLHGCQVVAAGLFLSAFAVKPALTEGLTDEHKAMLTATSGKV